MDITTTDDFELSRRKELYNLKILDTAKEERFDRFTRLIADIFNVPIALVSLVDANRQWFKSCIGVDVNETPRNISFCAYAIHEKEILVIPDATKDSRFENNLLVLDEPKIRFYAGAIIKGPSGMPLGTVCIIDKKARDFSERQQGQLIQFAKLVEREILLDSYINEIRTKAEESLNKILREIMLKQ